MSNLTQTAFTFEPQASPATARKHKPTSIKRFRRLFWTSMKYQHYTPAYIATIPPDGLTLITNYRLILHIAGWYNLTRLSESCVDWWQWMYARQDRLRKLWKGYDQRGNQAKADYYYRLYNDHTYHL